MNADSRFRQPRPYRTSTLLALGLALCWAQIPLEAQVVRGTARERTSGAPVSGVLITLEPADSAADAGSVVDRSALTNLLGEFALRAPAPGTYRLVAKRIGVQRHVTVAFSLAAGETRRVDLELESAAYSLEQIVVTKEALCVTYEAEARRVAALWDDIAAALTATEVSARDSLVRGTMTRYARALEPERLRVLREAHVEATGLIHRPFASPPAETLATHGYWRIMPADTLAFFGPDNEVLASDAFRRNHCFSLARSRRDRPGLLGLAFEPIAGRQPKDITGTVWVDEATSELRLVEFTYTGLARVPHIEHVGGEVHFDRLPNGGWIVRRWFIRMPRFGYLSWAEGSTRRWSAQGFQLPRVDEFLEEGGSVRGELVREHGEAVLSGTVLDSTGAPWSGVRVRLSGTAHVAEVDAAGNFAFGRLTPGRYAVALEDSGYARYGVVATQSEIELGEREEVTLELRAADTDGLVGLMCRGAEFPADRGAMRVLLVDAGTGQPIPHAEVRLKWSEYGSASMTGGVVTRTVRPMTLNGITDDQGSVTFCGLPAQTEMEFGFATGEDDVRRITTLRLGRRVAVQTVRATGR